MPAQHRTGLIMRGACPPGDTHDMSNAHAAFIGRCDSRLTNGAAKDESKPECRPEVAPRDQAAAQSQFSIHQHVETHFLLRYVS